MIESVDIRNFKCFREISIPTKPLTVLSGVNGMGKSTFIQTFLLLRQFVLESPGSKNLSLNGPLVCLGYSDDILHDNAEEGDQISFTISESGKKRDFIFTPIKGEQLLSKGASFNYSWNTGLFHEDFYYLGAERIGPRASFLSLDGGSSSLNTIGNSGEYCARLLLDEERASVDAKRLHPSGAVQDLRSQVEAWLSDIGQTTRIYLDAYKSIDRINLQFSFIHGRVHSDRYRPTNVGFGLTYVLPIFVAALTLKQDGLLIVENPEAHLHPRGQAMMGKFLSRVAASGVQVIVETHSDHLLNGIRVAAKNGLVDPSDVALHFFQKAAGSQSTTIVSPVMDKDGRLDQWPEGFFDEWETGLAELL